MPSVHVDASCLSGGSSCSSSTTATVTAAVVGVVTAVAATAVAATGRPLALVMTVVTKIGSKAAVSEVFRLLGSTVSFRPAICAPGGAQHSPLGAAPHVL
eukprot:18248-Heterococcus_DN1.PRE.5